MLQTRALATVIFAVPDGAGGLGQTATTLKEQSLKAFRAVLIVAENDAASNEAAEALAVEDARFVVHSVPAGLDWVAQINTGLATVKSEFAAILRCGDALAPGLLEALVTALKETPEAVLAHPGGDGVPWRSNASPYHRLLCMMTHSCEVMPERGVFRCNALAKATPLPSVSERGAMHAFLARLAGFGAFRVVDAPMVRTASKPAAPMADAAALTAWAEDTAAVTKAALAVEASAQDMRLMWITGVSRLVSATLSARVLGRTAFTEAERSAMVETFLDAMQDGDETIDVPYLLDQDWERLRHWTKAYLWDAPTSLDVTEFGPQPVNAGTPFETGGTSTLWIQTRERIPLGAMIKLGGAELETEITGNRATAKVPATLTDKPGELPLLLVSVEGKALTKPEAFWVLQKSGFGRGMARFLRKIRGQAEPGSRIALPAPSKK